MGRNEDNLTKQLFLVSLEISPQVDKLCVWMLAGTGATVAIMVANIEGIGSLYDHASISIMFTLLSISALFGLASKVNGLKAQNIRIMFQNIFSVMGQHPETDVMVALETYIRSFPFWVRWRVKRGARKGFNDELYGFRSAHITVIYQNLFASLQGVFLIVFIMVAAITVGKT